MLMNLAQITVRANSNQIALLSLNRTPTLTQTLTPTPSFVLIATLIQTQTYFVPQRTVVIYKCTIARTLRM